MSTRGIVAAAVGILAATGFAIHRGERPVQAFSEAFTDVTDSAGISWKHFSGESDDRFLIEAMGGGVAFADFDNDGLPDIFLVTGGDIPRNKAAGGARNALYHNLGKGKFAEIAGKAGVDRIPFMAWGLPWPISITTASRIC